MSLSLSLAYRFARVPGAARVAYLPPLAPQAPLEPPPRGPDETTSAEVAIRARRGHDAREKGNQLGQAREEARALSRLSALPALFSSSCRSLRGRPNSDRRPGPISCLFLAPNPPSLPTRSVLSLHQRNRNRARCVAGKGLGEGECTRERSSEKNIEIEGINGTKTSTTHQPFLRRSRRPNCSAAPKDVIAAPITAKRGAGGTGRAEKRREVERPQNQEKKNRGREERGKLVLTIFFPLGIGFPACQLGPLKMDRCPKSEHSRELSVSSQRLAGRECEVEERIRSNCRCCSSKRLCGFRFSSSRF